jgi:hypothetical protein
MSDGPYYQTDAHSDAMKQSKPRIRSTYIGNTRVPNDKLRVRSDPPFQAAPGGVGIGGVRRKRTIDKAVDDMS